MTATSGSLDPIPWADLAVEHRATLDARLAAVMGETDPAGHWQAMRPEDQRAWLWQEEHPDEARGAYAAELQRLSAAADPDTDAAFAAQVSADDHVPAAEDWPKIDAAAFYGLAGDIVRSIEPNTEADPVGMLLSFLAFFGAAVGSGRRARADGADHPARLFVVLVGETAKAQGKRSETHPLRIRYGRPWFHLGTDTLRLRQWRSRS